MSDPKYAPGRFVWRELIAQDVEAAKGFFGELVGWTYEAMKTPNGTYHVIKAGERPIGGVMKTPMPGAPACWSSYLSVADVDASLKAVEAAGGKTLVPPMDIPVGRFAIVADPYGAAWTLWRGKDGDGDLPERPGLGEFCWETVTTPDLDGARSFYQTTLGWTLGPDPSGNPGQVFLAGDTPVADVQQSDQHPAWLTYVVVEDVAASEKRVTDLGGAVVMPAFEVPDTGTILLIQDPTGAYIGLFQAA